MDSNENGAFRISSSKYQSKLQPPQIPKLHEMSASESNARSAMMPPPQVNGLKHKPTGLPEPGAKVRKTLAERAGDSASFQPPLAPTTRNTSATATSTIPGQRNSGFSSSTSNTRLLYSSARASSNARTASAVTKPPSAQSTYRSQSALGHSRSHSHNPTSRPGTALNSRVSGPTTQSAKVATNCNAPLSLSLEYPLDKSKDFITYRRTRVISDSSTSITSCTSRSASGCTDVSVGVVSAQAAQRLRPASLQQLSQRAHLKPRVTSLCTGMESLSLVNRSSRPPCGQEGKHAESHQRPMTPFKSSLPVPSPKTDGRCPAMGTNVVVYGTVADSRAQTPSIAHHRSTSPSKRPSQTTPGPFLSRDSNLRAPTALNGDPFCPAERLAHWEGVFEGIKSQMEGTTFERTSMKEILELLRARVAELEAANSQMNCTMSSLQEKLEQARNDLFRATSEAEITQRKHEMEVDQLERKHSNAMEDALEQHRKEIDRLRRDARDIEESLQRESRNEMDDMARAHREQLVNLERDLRDELEQEKRARMRELQEFSAQRDAQLQDVAVDIGKKEREAELVRTELRHRVDELEREKEHGLAVKAQLADATENIDALERANRSMRAKIEFLESDNQQQSHAFADLHKRTQEAIEAAKLANDKVRAEETLRRKLHNQVQELKGNIRVFCRVRPTLSSDEDDSAKIEYPDDKADSKELTIMGPEQKSALGNISRAPHNFSFDRVFGPQSANSDVFDEISQLVQSALDGYNVCIFCYGQTGSGKTHTMSSPDGMIPRAVRQIYDTAKSLEEKGWTYRMEGSFVEVYNENLNDLLGRAEDFDKKKHEIRHDAARQKTSITDITTVLLDSPDRVAEALQHADGNRRVAATKANHRSSRSHSVFILSLVGDNSITGEHSEGTLNLVDLAGSERLAHSQATGDRLKETQNINKSLSCLGDVIAALGRGGGGDSGHVPYRNSKLTYLLQYSLGGNSKTLMFVMISPLQTHLSETLTSLKFATKVHNTHIGTAKRVNKIKD